MSERQPFDLEERTTEFGKRVVRLCRALPRDAVNSRLVSQLVGSAGSVGANYREANDSLGKKDFLLRLRIARRECKEALHWLALIAEANPEFHTRMTLLTQEGKELKYILIGHYSKKRVKSIEYW
jgi:four helix bundle protein